ncbi:MAG TPA: sigma-70 family RNA polymerase sigma factor [Candidatus Hydrogenedentes bacterium]|nr:sigma-70 family RNA polymerase sigma factor [Candidatus Hydrogenedentota bacterium]
MSDADAVREVLAGQHERFRELVERHFASVYAVCLSYVRDATEAEDAAQDTFVQCYRRLDTLKNPRKLAGWLAAIARNVAVNHVKADSRRKKLVAELGGNGMDYEPPADAARLELRETIQRMVDGLPAKTREAVYLFYFKEKSLKEIAEYLGTSPNAVARLLKYGRERLKDTLWQEASDSIRTLRPKKDAVVRACLAVPFGQAAWPTRGGATATGAVEAAGLMGGIIMSTKSVVSIIVVFIAIVLALLFWKPWTREMPASTDAPAAVSQAEHAAPALHPGTSVIQTEPEPRVKEQAPEPTTEEIPTVLAEEPATVPAVVSGCVMDIEGYAIDGADVYFEVYRGMNSNDIVQAYSAQTDGDGNYEITGIEAFGNAHAFAWAEGYVMAEATELRLKVDAGTNRAHVDFRLRPATAFVGGRVVDEGRRPISGAAVDVMYYGYDEEGLAVTAATGRTTGTIGSRKLLFAITDERGRFSIAIPYEGMCDFRVVKEGYGPGFFPQIHTGTSDAVFVLRAGGAIEGKVTRADDGEPVEGIQVRIHGEALPGGLAPSEVRIQDLPTSPVVVATDRSGRYLADGLGADFLYTVTVLDPGAETAATRTDEMGVRYIANMLLEFDGWLYGAEAIAAQKRGVRVRAGQTTAGVDLEIAAKRGAVIYGNVSDRATGEPVCPVAIQATVVYPEGESGGRFGGTAVTDPDGTYTLHIKNLREPHRFRISYHYFTQGGSSWGTPEDAELAEFDLEAGDEEEFNFSVDAPMTVPVRFVDDTGAPVEGVMAMIRLAGGGGACGGPLSDEEGQVIFYGIPAGPRYEVMARRGEERLLGISKPFTGQPGETVPEILVVCPLRGGGIEGIVTDAQGNVVPNVHVACWVLQSDGTYLGVPGVYADEQGAFYNRKVAVGFHQNVLLAYRNPETGEFAHIILNNVEVAEEAVTDLGKLTFEPTTSADLHAIVGIRD